MLEIQKPLRRLLRRQRGRESEIEAALGYRRSSLARIARGEQPPAGERFYRALELLGEDPQSFVERAARKPDPEALLEELVAKAHRIPLVVRVRRAARRVQITIRDAGPQGEALVPRDMRQRLTQGLTMARVSWMRDHLPKHPVALVAAARVLDAARHEQPAAIGRLAECLAVDLCPQVAGPESARAFCIAVGVLASSKRMVGQPVIAASLLLDVIPLSWKIGPATEARLLQYVAYVLKDCAKLDEARAVAARAGAIYGEIGDINGVATTLEDRGRFAYLLGDLATAAQFLRHALEHLPPDKTNNRGAVLHVMSQIALDQDDIATAVQMLAQAELSLDGSDPQQRAALAYTKAEIARRRSQHAEAIAFYKQARTLAQDPFDRALATLDIIRALIELGQRARAATERRRLHALMMPLRHHPAALAGVVELCRIDQRALNLSQVGYARQVITQARAQS